MASPSNPSRGDVSVRVILAAALVVVALAVIVVRVQIATDTAAERAYAELRISQVPDSVVELGPVDDRLRETSGLAVGAEGSGVLWSHNDSGDEARFYALDRTGRVVAVFDVAGVEAQDWEAMDAGPCPVETRRRCLYLADTGDNVRRRDILEVHVVPEPDPAGGSAVVEPVGRLRYLYPDGSRDAEAVAVSPAGDLVVVTKGRASDIRLFRLEAARVRRAMADDEPVRLDAGVVLPLTPDWEVGRVVTGAGFRPDGSVLAVRTLSEIYFFAWPGLTEAAPPCFLGTREPQGEAVAWDVDGALLLTSETNMRGRGMLLRVRCRGVV